jgi:broad specificity phosphatase PhoE
MSPASLWMRHGTCDDGLCRPGAHARPDCPLTIYGTVEAELTARELHKHGWQPALVTSSSLRRARQTASIVAAALGAQLVQPINAFTEWRAPYCVLGRTAAQYPPDYQRWRDQRSQEPDSALPGGESLRAFAERAVEAAAIARDLITDHGAVLIVSHRPVGATQRGAQMINDHPNDRILPHESEHEQAVRHQFARLLASTPIPPEELVDNLALYLRRQPLTDLLSLDALYRMIIDVPGVIMEFGVHRGRHLAAFTALRGVYEPYNPHRRIIGFDTFTGFPDVAEIDTISASAVTGRFALPGDYPTHLRAVLDTHEKGEHLGHIQRTLVIQGDVRETLPQYLDANQHTVIALAYFDLDLYEPTRSALETFRPYLTKGTVLAFDELAHAKWPGETAALRDTLGTDHGKLRTLPGRATPAYLRWGA